MSKRLVRRDLDSDDRRAVTITLTETSARLVMLVTDRRRAEIAAIMEKVPAAQRSSIVEALTTFRVAAGIEDAPSIVRVHRDRPRSAPIVSSA